MPLTLPPARPTGPLDLLGPSSEGIFFDFNFSEGPCSPSKGPFNPPRVIGPLTPSLAPLFPRKDTVGRVGGTEGTGVGVLAAPEASERGATEVEDTEGVPARGDAFATVVVAARDTPTKKGGAPNENFKLELSPNLKGFPVANTGALAAVLATAAAAGEKLRKGMEEMAERELAAAEVELPP